MPADRLAAASWQETVRITDACTACGACLATCPEAALRKAPKRPLVLDASCTACWACIEICPADAIVEVPGPKGRTSPLTDSLGPEGAQAPPRDATTAIANAWRQAAVERDGVMT